MGPARLPSLGDGSEISLGEERRLGDERLASAGRGADEDALVGGEPREQREPRGERQERAPRHAPREEAPQAAPAAASSRAGMPRIQSFTLPVAEMQAVAQGSGLEWVNSNPERIAAVQAAIAAEPKPVHVPRERPPLVILDEGPLVLVETRKDL